MGPDTLRTSADFERVFAEKNKFYKNGLGFYLRFSGGEGFRFGLVTPKRFGIAVERNKFRRRVRELIRREPKLPLGVEMVICAYKPFREMGFQDLQKTFIWAFDRIRRQKITGKTSFRKPSSHN